MVSARGEWVYTIVEDLTSPHLHCFSTSTENLEQAMHAGEWECFVGDGCTHMHMHTSVHEQMQECTKREIIFLCCSSLCKVSLLPPPHVRKDVMFLEPHPHHTLLASFGTEEVMDNTHMWCEV